MAQVISENWRRYVAMVIVIAYTYQLILWPLAFWFSTLLTTMSGMQWPAPPVVPWEHLLAGTATLAAIGGIDVARDTFAPTESQKMTQRL